VIFRVIDIETVVDESVWTQGKPKYQIAPSPVVVAGVTAELVDVVPPPHACRVVAISCVDLGFDPARESRYWLDSCWTACRWASPDSGADAQEALLLAAFAHAMETTRDVHLVTWNGRTFDLPVLAMRSLKHKIAASWYYKDRDVRYRYSTEGHLDLMDFLGDYGATRFMKLGDIARLCGLPGKTDTTGTDVAEIYASAQASPAKSDVLRARVARYCLQDTLQTALVHLRALHLRGKITPETHDAVLETFRASSEVAAAIDLPWDRLWMCESKQRDLPGVMVPAVVVPEGQT
jgi:predicted PolB exonuclease-like 3'-5' exonuclease